MSRPRTTLFTAIAISAALFASLGSGCGFSTSEPPASPEATADTGPVPPPPSPAAVTPPPAAAPVAGAPEPTARPEVDSPIKPITGPAGPVVGSGHFNGYREPVITRVAGVRVLAVSPDGRFVVAGRQVGRSGTLLQAWEVATGQSLWEVHEPLGVTAVAFDPAGQRLAYGAGDNSLVLQPLPSGPASRWTGHRLSIGDLAFSPDGLRLASFGNDARLLVWDAARGTVIGEAFDANARFASQVRFAGDNRIWTRGSDAVIRWYDVAEGALSLRSEVKLPEEVRVAAADDEKLYGWLPDQRLQVIDAATGQALPTPVLEDAAADSPRPVVAIAAKSHDLAAQTPDGTLTVWAAGAFDSPQSWTLPIQNVSALTSDPGGRFWAVHSYDGGLLVFDRERPEEPQWLERTASVAAAPLAPPRFSPDGTTLLSMKDAETVLVSEIATGLTRGRLPRPRPSQGTTATSVTALCGNLQGAVFCGTSAGGVERLQPELPATAPPITIGKAAITALALSPDELTLLAGDADGLTAWVDLRTSAVLSSQRQQMGRIISVDFSPDGRWAATASGDQTIVVWDVARRASWYTMRGHTQSAQAVAFSPDSQWLASGDRTGLVVLWNITTGAQVWSATLRPALVRPASPAALPGAANEGITAIAFSSDQRLLAVGTAAGYTTTFNLQHKTEMSPLFHSQSVSDLALANDLASLLVATQQGDVSRWWRAPDPPRLLAGHQGSVKFAALDAAGRRAVTGGVDRQLKIWDVEKGVLVNSLDNAGEVIAAGALSPDGQRAVTSGYGSGIMFWDLAEMKPPVKRYGHKKRVWSLAFSPDGETVATGSDDQTVKLWSFSTQQLLRTIEHDALVHFVRFSPDGTKLLTSTLDARSWQLPARLQLWDTATGKSLREFKGHRMTVNSAVFNPEGSEITSCGADGGVCRWSVVTGERLEDSARPHGLSHAGLIQGGRSLVMRRFNNGAFIDLAGPLTRLSEFNIPTRAIGDLNVASEGNRIIAGTEEGAVYVWSLGHE